MYICIEIFAYIYIYIYMYIDICIYMYIDIRGAFNVFKIVVDS